MTHLIDTDSKDMLLVSASAHNRYSKLMTIENDWESLEGRPTCEDIKD